MIMLEWLSLRLRAGVTEADARALDAYENNCTLGLDSPGPHEGGKWADLSPKLQAAITNEIQITIGERDERVLNGQSTMTEDQIYWSVIGYFGLDCPHPHMKIHDHGSGSRPNPDITECRVCHTIIVGGETAKRFPLKERI